MALDTQARLTLYKAQEAQILSSAQSVQTEGQGAVLFARLETVRSAISDLEQQLAAENRIASRRRGPRFIVADMRRQDG